MHLCNLISAHLQVLLLEFVSSLGFSSLAPGNVLYEEGQVGREFHVILSGVVSVQVRSVTAVETLACLLKYEQIVPPDCRCG